MYFLFCSLRLPVALTVSKLLQNNGVKQRQACFLDGWPDSETVMHAAHLPGLFNVFIHSINMHLSLRPKILTIT